MTVEGPELIAAAAILVADAAGSDDRAQCSRSSDKSPENAAHELASKVRFNGGPISVDLYKGFTVTPRTFQVRGSNRWTVDILIARHARTRAFSSTEMCETEQAAVIACLQLGRRVIDRGPQNCGVDELKRE